MGWLSIRTEVEFIQSKPCHAVETYFGLKELHIIALRLIFFLHYTRAALRLSQKILSFILLSTLITKF